MYLVLTPPCFIITNRAIVHSDAASTIKLLLMSRDISYLAAK